jgi:hypothetical protein
MRFPLFGSLSMDRCVRLSDANGTSRKHTLVRLKLCFVPYFPIMPYRSRWRVRAREMVIFLAMTWRKRFVRPVRPAFLPFYCFAVPVGPYYGYSQHVMPGAIDTIGS